jgi:hypothetical protein
MRLGRGRLDPSGCIARHRGLPCFEVLGHLEILDLPGHSGQ